MSRTGEQMLQEENFFFLLKFLKQVSHLYIGKLLMS